MDPRTGVLASPPPYAGDMTTGYIRALIFRGFGSVVIVIGIVFTLATRGNFIPVIAAGILFILAGNFARLRALRKQLRQRSAEN